MTRPTVVADLNTGLKECLAEDLDVRVWGEDILSPYGGAFKVTRDLSDMFPDRVMTTPISEAAIVGMGVGAAMRGLKPVVEIMFGDFVTLAADQLINHAAKFAGMFNGRVPVPLVVRTPMGGGRGYGPTHSQSLEKHLLGVPGLRVVAPSHFVSPGRMLKEAVLRDTLPVLFIENKLLYPLRLQDEDTDLLTVSQIAVDGSPYPITRVRNHLGTVTPDVTLVSYGGMSRLLEQALTALRTEEVWVEAFLPVDLTFRSLHPITESARRTCRLLAVEEGAGGFGYGDSVISLTAQAWREPEPLAVDVLSASESVIPCEREMESGMLVSADEIVGRVLDTL